MQRISYMCGQFTVSAYATVVKKVNHFKTIFLRFERAQRLAIFELQ